MTDAPFPWIYHGLWGVLVRWFRVPQQPPALPSVDGESVDVYRAAPGYLRYRRIGYWIGLVIAFLVFFVGLAAFTVAIPPLGIVLALPVLMLFAFLSVLNYVALYLEYDTTWYAVGESSVRARSGVWINREITVNYDNVQNVSVKQGPLQRRFGISDVRIDTAGMLSAGNQYQSASAAGVSLVGLSNAEEVKRLIQKRCDASQSAGLGDEDLDAVGAPLRGWSAAHIELLREIRDAAKALAKGSGNEPQS